MSFLQKNIWTAICLLCPFFLFAQEIDYRVQAIPISLLKNADAIVRYESTHFQVKSTSQAEEEYRLVVTILNDRARLKDLYLYYNEFIEPGKAEAVIYNAAGQEVRKIKNRDMIDRVASDGVSMHQDARIRYFNQSYSEYPYTIDFRFSRTHKKSAFSPDWTIQQYKTAIMEGEFAIRIPKGTNLRYKSCNIDLKPQITEADNTISYIWKVDNRPALVREHHAPPPAQVLPMVMVEMDQFEFGKHRGDMSSWVTYGKFYHKLNSQADNMSAEMTAKVKQLTADATSDAEKIDILYRYLQENMRYVSVQLGVGGWKAYDAQYVEKNKYGDCKALTYFMKSMLNKVGIEANPALVYAGPLNYEVDNEFVTPKFNHIMLHVPSEDYWLECTSSTMPPNYLGSFTGNRNVLLIDRDNSKLVRTPVYDHSTNKTSVTAQIALSADGSATVSGTNEITGIPHEGYRHRQFQFSEEELRDWFVKMQSHQTSVQVKSFDLQTERDQPLARVKYDLHYPKFASKAGRRLFVPLNCLDLYEDVPGSDDTRINRIHIDESMSYVDKVKFTFPEGYQIESIPEERVEIDTEMGTYLLKVTPQAGGLLYERQLITKSVDLPASEYERFRDFFVQVAKMDKLKVVLVKQKT